LIVDDEFCYRLVKNHVFECNKCDPTIVLKHYLDRRIRKNKFQGFTSGTQVKLAFQYYRHYKDTSKAIPIDLIKEFIWRSGDSTTLRRYENLLSNMEIWEAVHLLRIHLRSTTIDYLRSFGRYKLIESMMNGKRPENDKEIDELMDAATVHSS